MMTSIVSQKYWDNSYEKLNLVYDQDNILFKDLFCRYLHPHGSCFEVGCYPGNYLIYLCKQFNYIAYGIDNTPFIVSHLPSYLKWHNIEVGNLYHEDFQNFESNEKYDVVCSFGFIEHFNNYQEIIEKHVKLVKPGGILIITCPNFRKIQYLYHRFLDFSNLQRHVLDAMDLNIWKEILNNNDMKILHIGYYKSIDFWADSQENCNNNMIKKGIIKLTQSISKCVDKYLNYPNSWTSPYMVCISQKNDKNEDITYC